MNQDEKSIVRRVNRQLEKILTGDFSATEQIESGQPELRDLSELVSQLRRMLGDADGFVSAISEGRLDVNPPPRNYLISRFKQLHASLRHLTWQTKQIAAGDLNQRVDFLGAFSVAFNSLIEALREKRAAEEKIRYLSLHDTLTDLYNRGYFEEELARVERGRNYPVSIIMADLDGLKKVNDTLGHSYGDMLIKDAANILRRAVRSGDVVARLGGDEFALILPGTDKISVAAVIDRIREHEAEVNGEAAAYQVGFSLGVATAEAGVSLSETLKTADVRMYQDKFERKKALAEKNGAAAV